MLSKFYDESNKWIDVLLDDAIYYYITRSSYYRNRGVQRLFERSEDEKYLLRKQLTKFIDAQKENSEEIHACILRLDLHMSYRELAKWISTHRNSPSLVSRTTASKIAHSGLSMLRNRISKAVDQYVACEYKKLDCITKEEEEYRKNCYNLSVDTLDLSTKCTRALKRGGVTTIYDLINTSPERLLGIRGVGIESARRILFMMDTMQYPYKFRTSLLQLIKERAPDHRPVYKVDPYKTDIDTRRFMLQESKQKILSSIVEEINELTKYIPRTEQYQNITTSDIAKSMTSNIFSLLEEIFDSSPVS